jgi:excisionase family DNA binding protein
MQKREPQTAPNGATGATLTTKQLATRWNVTAITIRRWRDDGRIRALKLSIRAVRYPMSEVLRIEKEATV